jgi:HD-like signal output (HDOD) protein
MNHVCQSKIRVLTVISEDSVSLPHPSDLPLFPRPAGLARVLLVYPDATIEDYVRVVSSDPALAAQVISLANSALNRGLEPVGSVKAAVVRLGIDTTRRATALMAMRAAFTSVADAGLDARELWWHVLGTALLAEAMCPDPEERSTAFTAGLMHDIGRLSLAALSPPRYAVVVRRVQAGVDVGKAERDEFSVTHTTWGEQIGQFWRLPPVLVQSITAHHSAADGVPGAVTRARDVLSGLGFGDGFGLGASPEGGDPDHESPALALIGGRDGLTARLLHFGEPED